MEIIKMKPEKLKQKFEKEFKIINYNTSIRQIKTEEYFIPQFYIFSGESNNGMFNYNNFINTRNYILSNISNSNYNERDLTKSLNDVEEKEKLIENKKIKKEIIDFFINSGKFIIHNNFSIILNKRNFIENIFKELTKIPDNEILSDNNTIHNLIIDSKKLINKLLNRNELYKNYIKISIKLSYYYDRTFYFVSINDEKKLYLKLSKDFHFNNISDINNKKQKHNDSSSLKKIIKKNLVPIKILKKRLKIT